MQTLINFKWDKIKFVLLWYMFCPHIILLLTYMLWIVQVRPNRSDYPGLNVLLIIVLTILNAKNFVVVHFLGWKIFKSKMKSKRNSDISKES